MRAYDRENLLHDPIHGYIPFTAAAEVEGEVTERDILDNAWVQRMRHIHQLQTAWWVYPSAEHTRFAHVVGAMHLGSRATAALYDSLREVCPDVPSRGYVETLLRMAGLLHDLGHGPFGHFFDEHFLKDYGLTHETVTAAIIRQELGEPLRGVRRNPNSRLADDERLDPEHVAWLVVRPSRTDEAGDLPRWLHHLRSLLSGLYTIDNMDFVLRDAYMSGYSQRAFDLERLLHYSFMSEHGLTIHDRGIEALLRFLTVRAELFRSIYFHRTVRAIDLTLADLFAQSKQHLFPGNPLDHLEAYREFTESSLLVDVGRWHRSQDAALRELGRQWRDLLERRTAWKMVCQRTLVFAEGDSEASSLFSDAALVERKVREGLPRELADVPLRLDIARHLHRPHTKGPAAGQNFLYDSSRRIVRKLEAHELYRRLPVSHRICRVYARTYEHKEIIAAALDALVSGASADDATNM